jgi:hypothetical protein
VNQVPLRTGDWVLLCSDGLPEVVRDAQIAAVLEASKTIADAADSLVRVAVDSGARDDISVVVVDYAGPSAAAWRSALVQHQSLWLPILIGTTAAALIATLVWLYVAER